MKTKTFQFNMDTKRPCLSQLRGVVYGDTQDVFEIKMTEDGESFVLPGTDVPASDTNVDAKFTRADGSVHIESGMPFDSEYVTIYVNTVDMFKPGLNWLELVIYQRASASSRWEHILTTQAKEIYVRPTKE